MESWLRRIRGALGLGFTWALGWAPIGALLGSALWIILDPPVGWLALAEINAMAFGALGFAGGTLFSMVLGVAEGRTRFDELKLPRFAGWGAVGGLLLGGLTVAAGFWGAGGIPLIGITVVGGATLLGAASAAGSLWVARQAVGGERLAPGEEVAELGSSSDESTGVWGGSR